MQCITSDRFKFNDLVDIYIKDDLPKMELIRDQPQVSQLLRENPKDVQKYLFLLLSGLNDSFKVNPDFKLNESEIIDLTGALSKRYYHYRLQDFAIFVKNAKEGKYGKAYNRLDVSMVNEWIAKYDFERDGVIEYNHMKGKGLDKYERGTTTERIQDNPEFRKIAAQRKGIEIQELNKIEQKD